VIDHRLGCPAKAGLYAIAGEACACGADEANAIARRIKNAAKWQRTRSQHEALLADVWSGVAGVAAYHREASERHLDTAELLEEATSVLPEPRTDAVTVPRSVLQGVMLQMSLARAYLNSRKVMPMIEIANWDDLLNRIHELHEARP